MVQLGLPGPHRFCTWYWYSIPSPEAYRVIERCVGQSVRKAFARISPAPVASASLGQVYRATLSQGLGGQEVAVKVQRPHVLAQVALDLFLMRWVATTSQKLPQVGHHHANPDLKGSRTGLTE